MKFCYGYLDFPEANNSIDELNLPHCCNDILRQTGVEYVGDVLDIYARYRLDPMTLGWMPLSCISPIFQSLIQFEGCPWRIEIECWLEK